MGWAPTKTGPGGAPKRTSSERTIGPFTLRFVETLLVTKPHPEAGYRAAMGVRPLASE
jgi:hypothetical protein